ncbi:MAG: hypothetical protein JXA36_05080 [Coriobacteriia bacterium]|nr:hypothetical protein [Coriobacteriia bacterium]
MSSAMIIAAVIVIVASLAFVAVGMLFEWDLTARGYAWCTQAIGVAALLGIAIAIAWGRLDKPILAAAVLLVGCGLAAGYVWLHRHFSERVRRTLASAEGS